jgi:hypothetical protein
LDALLLGFSTHVWKREGQLPTWSGVRVRVRVRVRARVRVRDGVRVSIRVSVRVSVRAGVRVRVGVGGDLPTSVQLASRGMTAARRVCSITAKSSEIALACAKWSGLGSVVRVGVSGQGWGQWSGLGSVVRVGVGVGVGVRVGVRVRVRVRVRARSSLACEKWSPLSRRKAEAVIFST